MKQVSDSSKGDGVTDDLPAGHNAEEFHKLFDKITECQSYRGRPDDRSAATKIILRSNS